MTIIRRTRAYRHTARQSLTLTHITASSYPTCTPAYQSAYPPKSHTPDLTSRYEAMPLLHVLLCPVTRPSDLETLPPRSYIIVSHWKHHVCYNASNDRSSSWGDNETVWQKFMLDDEGVRRCQCSGSAGEVERKDVKVSGSSLSGLVHHLFDHRSEALCCKQPRVRSTLSSHRVWYLVTWRYVRNVGSGNIWLGETADAAPDPSARAYSTPALIARGNGCLHPTSNLQASVFGPSRAWASLS